MKSLEWSFTNTLAGLSSTGGFSQFVGRQHEITQVQRAFALTKEGHGQIVGVIGDPGVGKSRLCHEFEVACGEAVVGLGNVFRSHGKTYPYLPLIDLLKNYFHITPQDDERKRRENTMVVY